MLAAIRITYQTLLTALSTIAAPSEKCAQILKGAGARGGDGGERGQSFNKSAWNVVRNTNQSLVSFTAFTALLLKRAR